MYFDLQNASTYIREYQGLNQIHMARVCLIVTLYNILGYNTLYIHSQCTINNRYPDIPLPTAQWVIGNRK